MDDLISRRKAIEAIEQLNIPEDMCVFEILSHIQLAIGTLPSAQPEKMQLSTEKMQLSKEDATKDTTFDCISRQAAIDAVHIQADDDGWWTGTVHDMEELLKGLPSAQPEHTETHECDCERTETHESCTDCPLYDHDRHNCPRFNKVIPRAIEEVKPRWIPVTERLPEEKGEYLVSYHPCYWDYVNDDIKSGIDSFRGKAAWAKKKYQRVIAWLPLPEPYKEEQDD